MGLTRRTYPTYRIGRLTVDTAAAVLALAMRSFQQCFFRSSVDINAPKTWALTHRPTAHEFVFRFNVTALPADITMPANVKMSDPSFESVVPNEYPIPNIGEYEAKGVYDGVNWNVSIIGLFV